MQSRPETQRLTPSAFSEELRATGMSVRTFARAFDVGEGQVRRWLMPEGRSKAVEPPYWVLPALRLCRRPGAVAEVIALREENAAPEGNSDAA